MGNRIVGHGQIFIKTELHAKEIQITLEDTGIPMSIQQIEEVFHPFQNGNGTETVRAKPHELLGLSVSYEILKKYNGSLEFEHKSTKGNVCKITLPVQENEELRTKSEE